jgi:hypothetical protein
MAPTMRTSMRSMLIVAVLAAAACTEDAAAVRPEPPSEPAFRYELYCDAQGHITTDGPVLALVRRPAHLKQVYADASRHDPRARELVREVELAIAQAGAAMAERSSAPHCLVMPELGCLPHWPFLDELFGDAPEAMRLRQVFARAYEARARQRGMENAVIAATVNLLLAHGMVEGTVKGAAKRLSENAGPTGQISPSEVIGKTPAEIDARARELGLEPRGLELTSGRGAYVDPRTGQQRILSHPTAHPPHGHVNDPAGQRIDANGQVVPPESPQAHLPIQAPAGQKP